MAEHDAAMARSIEGTIWADLETWRPARHWASVVDRAAKRLAADRGDVLAWAELAMMLGDSRAADLGLIVCLRAERLSGTEKEPGGVAAHRNLCLLQLGLATPRIPGLIALREISRADFVAISTSRLDAWVARQLIPFDGDLEAAADFVLQLARARTGLRDDEPAL